MTAREAHDIFKLEREGFEVLRCHEYKSVYVFNAVPKGVKSNAFDSLHAVEKSTGRIRAFNPLQISLEEYKNGKEVPLSVFK